MKIRGDSMRMLQDIIEQDFSEADSWPKGVS